MGYRDERDADRARIDALERELLEAREKATRAEAEARAARAEALATEKESAPKRSKRAERKRAKKKRERAASVPQRPSVDSFPEAQRRRYFRVSVAVSVVAYTSTAALTFFVSDEEAFVDTAIIGGLIAAVAIAVGHVIVGYATRAPGVFNGAMITLIASSVSLGGAAAAAVGVETVFAAGRPTAAHILVVALALLVGAFLTAHWSSEAASSSAVSGD